MKKRIITFCLALLLMSCCMTSCQNRPQEALQELTAEDSQIMEVEEENKTQEIAIVFPRANGQMKERYQYLADIFREQTGITVHLQDAGIDEFMPNFDAAYHKQMTTELMGGLGADIYFVDSAQAWKLGNQGLLFDFSTLFENSPDWDEEAMLHNVLRAASPDEHVYAIPLRFPFYYLAANTEEDVERLKTRTFDFTAFFEEAPRDGKLYLYAKIDQVFEEWFYQKRDELIDLKNMEQPINTKLLAEMVEQLEDWEEEGLFLSRDDGYSDDYLISRPPYVFQYLNTMDYHLFLQDDSIQTLRDDFYHYAAFMPREAGQEERLNIITQGDCLVINNASKNREAAVDFIHFLLSYHDDPQYIIASQSVQIDAFREGVQEYLEESLDKGYIDLGDKEIETVCEEIVDFFQNIETFRHNGILDNTILTHIRAYFYGNSPDLETVMKQMQQEAILILMETQA